MSYVKLDSCILDSSLWLDRDAREVFITALLMAEPFELDRPAEQLKVGALEPTGFVVPPGWYGFVPAAGPGLVNRAGAAREAGMAALARLGSEEAESRSKGFGGRRLVRIDGGFLVLNYMNYREKDHTGAERQRRHRLRKAKKEMYPNWDAIVAFYGGRCAYCEAAKWESVDHVVPRSKGGPDDQTNVVPCCGFCNSSKCDRPRQPKRRHPFLPGSCHGESDDVTRYITQAEAKEEAEEISSLRSERDQIVEFEHSNDPLSTELVGQPEAQEGPSNPDAQPSAEAGPPCHDADPTATSGPPAGPGPVNGQPAPFSLTHPETDADREAAAIARVFETWRRLHATARSKLDDKRRARVRARLGEGFTADELEAALRGALKDDWLMGRDPKTVGRSYRALETLLRDAAQVEKLVALDAAPDAPRVSLVRSTSTYHGLPVQSDECARRERARLAANPNPNTVAQEAYVAELEASGGDLYDAEPFAPKRAAGAR